MFKYLFNNRFRNKIRSDLSKMPKTYWFGGMALGMTIHLLMDMLFFDMSKFLHILTSPFTPTHMCLVGINIAPIIIFALLYMRERTNKTCNKEE